MAGTDTTARHDWQVWGLAASVVVTDPSRLAPAVTLARHLLDAVDLACSRFRADAELTRRRDELAGGATVSALLATLMASALAAARWTDGAVDPTLGNDLVSLGYDGDFAGLSAPTRAKAPEGVPAAFARPPRWHRITLDGRVLTVPADVVVDLGATAKAVAADLAAARIAAALGCGVLVNLGGDIATAGPAPAGHWQVLVQDTRADPAQQVSLPAGHALATSSTMKRRWRQAGVLRHHILDPRFGLPADTPWRSVSVAAPTALAANACSTAAIVKGRAAPAWLRGQGISARLIDQRGQALTTADWPAVGPVAAGAGPRG
ncbi:FAD:protein FMN transferase [Specibacter sp. RAF43]|uniref:FAD:protein FMN transferase n=1 Tax=Specibacter sp. RAF43 TaxID=3233057 RepID=UPI003F98EDB2